MLKLRVKKFVLWLNILSLIILSSCNISPVSQQKIYESDITEFYNSNCVLFNKAVEEYKFNTEGKVINIFYTENLILDGFAGLADEKSEIVVWEPETKINHTEHISKYENCVAILKLMNDYMIKCGYKQKNEDYVVTVTSQGLNNDYTVDNIDNPFVVSFKFADVKCNVSYSLYYSETELTDEFTQIDTSWYVDVWHRV